MKRLLIAVAAGILAASTTMTSDAHVVPGEYSLAIDVVPDEATLGSEFLVTLGVFHNEAPYQAAQWRGTFSSALVQPVGAGRHLGAPLTCFPISHYTDGTIVAHCIDVTGPTLTYSGVAIDLFEKCVAPGVATYSLLYTIGATAKTFVKVGATLQPIHTHDDVITCVDGLDTDGDGCEDVYETGSAAVLGGLRAPNDRWDFFDVTYDHAIDLSDALDVLQYFGVPQTTGMNLRDRYIPDMDYPWRTAESNDGVDLSDVLVNLQSYGHGCGT